MHVLIYIEPLIECGLPLAKSYWVHNWVPRLAASLKAAFGDETRISLVGGSTFLAGFTSVDVDVFAIDSVRLLDLWQNDPDQMLVEAFRWREGPAAISIAERVKPFIPDTKIDVVLVIGAQGYHRKLFPGIPILYHEFSLLRTPGPDTWYFDHVGPGGSAWFEQYWKSFKPKWEPTVTQLEFAERYRDEYRLAVLQQGGLEATVRQFSERFDKTVLLPLQMDGAATFTSFSPISSQLNLILGIRSRLPASVGMIVTEHPRQLGGLTDDSRQYLQGFENLLVIRQGKTFGPSDEVAPFVDGIATVTSTVGALAFLWSKSLISLTGQYLAPFANHLGPPPWGLEQRDERADLVLIAFLMAHWAVPAAQLEDPDWIRSLVEHAIALNAGEGDPGGIPIPAWSASAAQIENAWIGHFASDR